MDKRYALAGKKEINVKVTLMLGFILIEMIFFAFEVFTHTKW